MAKASIHPRPRIKGYYEDSVFLEVCTNERAKGLIAHTIAGIFNLAASQNGFLHLIKNEWGGGGRGVLARPDEYPDAWKK